MRRKPVVYINRVGAIALLALSLAAFTKISWTQGTQSNRIRGLIDERSISVVRGHLHPLARPQFDQGRLDPGVPLHRITMALNRTEAQQASLNALLRQQQDPSSPNYH